MHKYRAFPIVRFIDFIIQCTIPKVPFIKLTFLPDGHPVRSILAPATVGGYLRQNGHKLLKETQEVPNFSADLFTAKPPNLPNTACTSNYERDLIVLLNDGDVVAQWN